MRASFRRMNSVLIVAAVSSALFLPSRVDLRAQAPTPVYVENLEGGSGEEQ